MISVEKKNSNPTFRRVPCTVRLSPSFVANFSASAKDPSARPGKRAYTPTGLLFGRLEDREITVESFRTFASFDPDGVRGTSDGLDSDLQRWFSAPKWEPELATLELIGWYAIAFNPLSGLTNDAAEFHNRYFRRISDLALTICSDGNSEWLGFYTRWANTAMSAQRHRWAKLQIAVGMPTTEPLLVTMRSTAPEESQGIEDKFVGSEHWVRGATERISSGAKPADVARYRQISAGDQISSGPNAPHMRVMPPGSAGAAIPASHPATSPLVGAGGGPAFSNSTGFGSARTGSMLRMMFAGLAVAAAIAGIALYMQPKRGSAEFGLRVEPKEDALLVTWDPHSKRLQSVTGGTLEIKDGSLHREIHLNSGELANGSVLYRPASADLVFRLSASSRNGPARSQDVRVEPRTIARLLNATGNPQSSVQSGAKQTAAQAGPRPTRNAYVGNTSAQSGRSETQGNVQSTNATPTTQAPAARSAELRTPQMRSGVTERGQESQRRGSERASGKAVKQSAATGDRNLSDAKQSVAAISRRDDSRNAGYNSAKTAAGSQSVYVPPKPITRVMPSRFSRESMGYKQTQIRVVVAINEFGRVTEAHLADDTSTENISLASAALSAAKQWVFQPATIGGSTVPSRHIIEFRFDGGP